jgi:hypothetical protein
VTFSFRVARTHLVGPRRRRSPQAKLSGAARDCETPWQNDSRNASAVQGKGGFAIEFGADGKLLIGGRERAKWRLEGRRVRLYRDTTGEEHWLDIVGDKLMWEGQEIDRVR